MLDDDLWRSVEHAINNFPVMMGGVMMIASARAASGQGQGPVGDPGEAVRGLVRDRLGKAQLDEPAARRVREGLTPEEARAAIGACADFAGDLPALTTSLTEEQMLAYIARSGPGEPAFDEFLQRFMVVGGRIQELFQRRA